MSDEEWKEFVDKKELAFADACSEALEDIKWDTIGMMQKQT
jgi:hypothetical protein